MENTLEVLRQAHKELTSQERAHFNDYFIGALSNQVPPELWNRAIETATNCMREVNP